MQTRRIGFACALGAFVGATVSLDLARHFATGSWLWIVGILLGGLVGYLAYDFRAVASAIGQAWREVSAWRPDWKGIGRGLFSGVTFLVCMVNVLALMGLWICGLFGFVSGFDGPYPHFNWSFLALFAFSMIAMVAFLQRALPNGPGPDLMVAWKALALLNPVVFPFTAVVWSIPRIPAAFLFTFGAMFEFAKDIWQLMKMCWPLMKRVFVLIHSDERKLCFTDAMLGAMIGFFLGSAVLGGIAGALLGVVNYELVSIRLLHLPRRA